VVTANQASVSATAGQKVTVDSAVTVSSYDTSVTGAKITIGTGYQSGLDTLNFTNQNGITGSYNSSTHVLTLSGSSSVANYQAALRSVTFSSTSDDPTHGGNTTRTITWRVDDGAAANHASNTPTTTVNVIAVDDPGVAKNDAFSIGEATIAGTGKNVFSNNGLGADSDVDSNVAVTAVNGSAANVGTLIALASGARLTLNANGTFIYDPSHAFDYLPAAGSGAANLTATDSFTYTIDGGGAASATATVTLTISGIDGNDTLQGTANADTLKPGNGNDIVNAGGGNDTIDFTGGQLNAADKIDGGTGTDTVYLSSDYTSGNAVVMSTTTMINVEKISLASGFSYTLTTNNATVASGQTLTINGAALGASDVLTFNGAAETNGHFVIIGGLGTDQLTGGALSDTFTYTSAAQSTSTHYDTITGFNFSSDIFDIPGAVGTITGINSKVTSGALSTATFDANLTSAISSSHLGAHHAVLFTPTSGTLSGVTFLIVDLNGVAGYQSGHDLVIRMNGATGTLAAGGFH